ncbi:sugar ABC transporter ATP-binding protein [Herbiconiux ginsengi]|uniref:Ribose transport system ATP-binding protein n=1 Tax=Herbiconiux ginsengi TaxID=381665 RepID=A0A1H3TV41_9MICO|nr:sugar ABC transporter ATP-binding protein [Herbiconiux ginsengi]SDZ54066.1 ribose transport system ATP-binding protein [Herbiconiux ginsengi]
MNPGGAPILLSCTEIAKSFGPTRALVEASLEVRGGEVHAILGENGSGKSTLVKIVAQMQRPDSGALVVTPRGRSLGPAHRTVATVFQEVLVVTGQSIVENVWLGADGVFGSPLPRRAKRRAAAEILHRLCGRELDLDAPVARLSLSDQQACCIARALVREPDLLVLDEATSALDLQTRDRFFDLLRELRADGMGTVFISHRMDELLGLSDRITVMKAGRTIATVDRLQATADTLVRLMTGGTRDERTADRKPPAIAGRPVLRADDLRLTRSSAPIDLALHAGEIVGVAGLEGHGQERLLLALWGEGAQSGSVTRLDGTKRVDRLRSPRQAARSGVAYVPRDRRKASIFAPLSIVENFAVTTLRADTRLGLISPKRRARRFRGFQERLAIRLGRQEDAITTLSGGNQQKAILARWLATEPEVLLLNDPTRGIDHGAKNDIYDLLRGLAAEGAAIAMLSSELEEHLTVMDRVIVMRENSVFAEFSGDSLTRENLVSAFFGVGEEVPA